MEPQLTSSLCPRCKQSIEPFRKIPAASSDVTVDHSQNHNNYQPHSREETSVITARPNSAVNPQTSVAHPDAGFQWWYSSEMESDAIWKPNLLNPCQKEGKSIGRKWKTNPKKKNHFISKLFVAVSLKNNKTAKKSETIGQYPHVFNFSLQLCFFFLFFSEFVAKLVLMWICAICLSFFYYFFYLSVTSFFPCFSPHLNNFLLLISFGFPDSFFPFILPSSVSRGRHTSRIFPLTLRVPGLLLVMYGAATVDVISNNQHQQDGSKKLYLKK